MGVLQKESVAAEVVATHECEFVPIHASRINPLADFARAGMPGRYFFNLEVFGTAKGMQKNDSWHLAPALDRRRTGRPYPMPVNANAIHQTRICSTEAPSREDTLGCVD